MVQVEKYPDSSATIPKVIVGLSIAAMVFVAGLVFTIARRLVWTPGWIYVGMVVAVLTINLACLLRWNPELIRRRMRVSKFTKTWDKVWAVLFGLAMITIYVAAVMEALDKVSNVPGAAWLLGLAIFVPGWILLRRVREPGPLPLDPRRLVAGRRVSFRPPLPLGQLSVFSRRTGHQLNSRSIISVPCTLQISILL